MNVRWPYTGLALGLTVLAAVLAGVLVFGNPPRPAEVPGVIPSPTPPDPFDFSDLSDTEPLPQVEFGGRNVPLIPPKRLTKYVPCMSCHFKIPPKKVRRELQFEHTRHSRKLKHGGELIWCYHCHDAVNQDKLRLADGSLIDYGQSHLQCGQCHGQKYMDWRWGVHGKRIGGWFGEYKLVSCVRCHNPHWPAFQPVEPLPRPGIPHQQKSEPAGNDEAAP